MTGPLVVGGVSGVGKSLIGSTLATTLGIPFVDADSLHSTANVSKMAAGIPLDDLDRWPWLDAVGAALAAIPAPVVACSVLKRSYRDRIRQLAPGTAFILLATDIETLSHRVAHREGHFMPPSLLASQLATLESLELDEPGITVDASAAPDLMIAAITRWIAASG